MNELLEARATMKNIIEKLCDSLISPEEASQQLINSSRKWSKEVAKDRLIRDSWECVMHYSTDSDIRERDPHHASCQVRDLREALDALRRAVSAP
jgi:hypothetical protein